MESKPISPLKDKSFLLAIRVVNLYRYLTETKREYVMSKQLLRAGTSPGAMIREAINAESGADFIHKLGIAQKELGEMEYWLELLWKTGYMEEKEFESIHKDLEEVIKMVKSSILTKKKNLGK
jgi:four helix bundle protein